MINDDWGLNKVPDRRNLEKFYGEDLKMSGGNYFRFRQVIDKDHIIILTENVKYVKESPVLFVSNNRGVYLKDWQLRKVSSHKLGINCYAVKLNRKYFNVYGFRVATAPRNMSSEYTFDDLVGVAKKQQNQSYVIREGWAN